MMRSVRKIRLLAFAGILMCFLVLSGQVFGGAQAESGPKGKTTIEVWHRWSGTHAENFNKMVEAFNLKSDSVIVKPVSVPGEYVDVLARATASVAAGQTPPAMIASGYFLIDYTVATFGAQDITKIGGDRAVEIFSRIHPAVLKSGQINGIQYAVPVAASLHVFNYNANIFKEAGLDPDKPPKTWAEVIDYARIIKKNTNKWPLYIAFVDSWLMQALIESNGTRMLQDGKAAFNTPEAVEAMQMWRDIYSENLAPRITYNEALRSFPSGEIAMFNLSPMQIFNFAQTLGDALRVVPTPSFGNKPTRMPVGGAGLVMSATDREQQEAAWQFIEFITTKEAMDIWVNSGYVSFVDGYELKLDPRQQAVYDQFPNAFQFTSWPGTRGLEAEVILQEYNEKIIYGEISAEEGLRRAQEEINKLLP